MGSPKAGFVVSTPSSTKALAVNGAPCVEPLEKVGSTSKTRPGTRLNAALKSRDPGRRVMTSCSRKKAFRGDSLSIPEPRSRSVLSPSVWEGSILKSTVAVAPERTTMPWMVTVL